MGALLLDTSIVSYMFKGDSRATLYYPHLRGQEPMIAMMTLAELFQDDFLFILGLTVITEAPMGRPS